MDLLIMALGQALEHEPEKRTYAIRIFSPISTFIRKTRLKDSPNYVRVAEYIFDDVDPESTKYFGSNPILFDNHTAERMLDDFEHYKPDCESLLVHCISGKNRSPAVGMAFNEIYSFGHDSKALKRKYPNANWYVYDILKKAAAKRRYPKAPEIHAPR